MWGFIVGALGFDVKQWQVTYPVWNTCMARLDYELTSPSDSRWEMKDVDVVFSDESSLPVGPNYLKNTKVPHIFDLQAAEKVTVPDGWVFFFLPLVHWVIEGTTNGRFVFGALHPVGNRWFVYLQGPSFRENPDLFGVQLARRFLARGRHILPKTDVRIGNHYLT